MTRVFLAGLTLALAGSLGIAAPGLAAQAPAQAPAQEQKPKPRFVQPVKGVADVGFLKPVVKVDKGEVVTTIKIKNLSTAAIAGLKIDEYWYDKAGNMLPGDSKRLRQPLLPGEVVTVELRTPKNPKMDRNSYQFTHAYGQVKTKVLNKID
ncbi:MAG: hypothetical protein H6Q08_1156 [Acidobacteria bacterium]|jgi:hypothetical protein|nr:hypothetical protein [Acidobacteriota bacterium]